MEEQCSSCSSSDSDEEFLLMCMLDRENKSKRTKWIHPINEKRETLGEFHHLFNELILDEERFFQYFRMDYERFCQLHSLIEPHIMKKTTNWRKPISTEERLAVCLRFLATGDTFRTIAFSYRMGRKTVADIVYEVCSAIWTVLQPIVMPPPTTEQWISIANDFEAQWQFPNCIGAIDGKHVVMDKPSNSGSLFFNYKKTFSTVLLAVVDANYKFIMIDVGAYGKSSDGGIFKTSQFGEKFLNNELGIPEDKELPKTNQPAPYVMVGDSGFPLLPSLMRQFPDSKIRSNESRKIFNYRLSRARRVSENAFGILSKRFRLYQRPLQLDVNFSDKVILATCALHNFLISNPSNRTVEDKRFNEEMEEKSDGEVQHALVNLRGVGGACSTIGMNVRQTFVDYFNSKAGEVYWQKNKVQSGKLFG